MGKHSGGYYAVANGRRTGVFTTWRDAEAQVKGFAGARFKKFSSRLEAEAFLHTPSGNSSSNSTTSPADRKRARSADESYGVAASISPPDSKRHAATSNAASSSGFYAVLEGHVTGVVSSWDDVVKHTHGYDRPLYRKFDTREAAEMFVSDYALARAPVPTKYVAVATATEPSSVSPSMGFWYAVAKGRKTGVFDNWADAKVQIDGLCDAKYKKFNTKAEAEAFVRDNQAATTVLHSDPDPKHPDSLVAFCDGSALQNGQFRCQAGFACIFPHNPTWNVAKKLVEDRATNNRAEYLAALEGMKRANQEDPLQTRPLFIFSDSMLLIRSMTEWITGWQRKNWVKADGNPVVNRDLLERLLKEQGSRRVIWRHVKAHTRKKDWRSKWNDVADHAARNAAAGWEPSSSSTVS